MTHNATPEFSGKSRWIRVLFILLFWCIFQVTQFVTGAVAIIQCGFVLITKQPNHYLQNFGASLSEYAKQIFSYVTLHSEHRPFPFADFPKSVDEEEVQA